MLEKSAYNLIRFFLRHIAIMAILFIGMPVQADMLDDLTAALGQGKTYQQAAQSILGTALSEGKDPQEVARSLTIEAIKLASQTDDDVKKVIFDISVGAVEGTVIASKTINADVASNTKKTSQGVIQGAIQAGAQTGQDLALVTQTASQGSTQGAIAAAANQGFDMDSYILWPMGSCSKLSRDTNYY